MKLTLRDPPPWIDPPVPDSEREGVSRHRLYEPGDCWYATEDPDNPGQWFRFADGPTTSFRVRHEESQEWRTVFTDHRNRIANAEEHQGKRPMLVVLPNRSVFNVYSATSDGTGWQVTGELPNVTVRPSIHRKAEPPFGWHGYLTDGVLKSC